MSRPPGHYDPLNEAHRQRRDDPADAEETPHGRYDALKEAHRLAGDRLANAGEPSRPPPAGEAESARPEGDHIRRPNWTPYADMVSNNRSAMNWVRAADAERRRHQAAEVERRAFGWDDARNNPWAVVDKDMPREADAGLLAQARKAVAYCIDQVETDLHNESPPLSATATYRNATLCGVTG